MLHYMTEPLEDDTPPEEELEMAAEEFTGKDTPGTTEQRIVALNKRIIYLQHQLQSLDESTGASKVAQDLAEARQQLARWTALREGRN